MAPVVLALADGHLATEGTPLVVSTLAACLATSALALQPLLIVARRRGRAVDLRWHRALGALTFALVLLHVAALATISWSDTRFALSPDGPTRARMALLATIALAVTVVLGTFRRLLPLDDGEWRLVHAFLAVCVIVLGVGHAVLTDGALDGPGTATLLAIGGLALALVFSARLVAGGDQGLEEGLGGLVRRAGDLRPQAVGRARRRAAARAPGLRPWRRARKERTMARSSAVTPDVSQP